MSSLPFLRTAARVAAGVLLAAWSVALIGWLTLHWGILPRLDGWRPQIEQRVGQALGVPVSIGAIRVRSGGWVPAFEVDDVRLLDREGRVALRLGKVSAALSPQSIWALEPRFAQLHLQGVGLDVRRAADGRVRVAGLDLGDPAAAGSSDPVLLDWFLQQQEFVIRAGALRWTDELRAAPPLVLSDVDIVLRNGRRQHSLRIDATPPADWGQRFALRGSFTRPLASRPSDFARWQGTLFAELPEADVSQLRRHVDLPFALEQGRGALRGWFDWADGRPAAATADLALSAVVLRLGADLPPLALAELRGRVQAQQDAGGLALAIEQLGFTTDDGQAWASSTLRLALKRDPAATADAPWASGELQLDRLSLAPLARLAARLPLPPAAHRALVDLAPQGEVSALALDWSGPPQAPWRYRAAARIAGLALQAGPAGPPAYGLPQTAGRPGLRGATVQLEATERGGQAQLALEAGAVTLPGVFEQPELALDSARAELVWTVVAGADGAPPAVVLEVRDAQLANADLALAVDGRWRTGPGTGFGTGQRLPGALTLQGRLLRGDAARVARYLPLGVPEHSRRYVERAFTAGRVTGGELVVDGDLWQFPFIDGSPGRFRIRAQVEGVRYAFVPSEPGWTSPWPALDGVTGTLEFDRAAMRIVDAQATLAGVALSGVAGGIEDLVHTQLLRLDGQARGALQDMLRFVNATPVGSWTGGALAQAQATGAADLTLSLAIPLPDPAAAKVRGGLQLAGNDLRLLPEAPLLGQARGRVDFTERGFTVQPSRAQVLGGELAFDGGTQADGSLRFRGQGQATAEALLRPGALLPLAPLLPWAGVDSTAAARPRLRGQAAYTVQMDLRQGRPEWLVTSPLTGLALDLPAPLAKPATATWPLRVQTRLASPAGRPAVELLSVDVEGRAQVRLERAADSGQLLRGSAGVGTAAPGLPSTGFDLRLAAPRVDLDAWQAAAPPGGMAAGEGQPLQVTLDTPELRLDGRRLQQVALTLQQRAAGRVSVWRAEGRADQGEGWIEWEPGLGPDAPGRVRARLSRLSLPERETPEAGLPRADAAASTAVVNVPSLSLVVDALQWRGKALGRLEVDAENRRGDGGGTEWQLDRLRLATPEATLLGRGLWRAGQRSSLAFDINLTDGGAFFERLGAGKAMQGAAGRLEGELSWPGSPLAPALDRVRGELKVALKEGRFLDAEPGVARLFGVLSLQALPRRLLLDFRDVFQQGFAFDRIDGEITLADGLARTSNLRVLGVQAAVLVEGQADIVRETQDLRIVAVPELNTAGASLAWAALNPAVGIGAFVAQLLLNKPVTAAATREFHVTGPWGEPKVVRVENADAPGAEAASAPASAARTTSP
ncbi:YhdP family protein [Rubrivivax albus]|uniref:TIGR02099 family protein n=1 Tax=Rubrivivax albus TaxID=2499835 RepID=A0A437JXS7_9BURK|nr:YhdP family protein [Rubrivivax albus]RVT52472.1 TIGR02099 family protein [Rubrivivax albus]